MYQFTYWQYMGTPKGIWILFCLCKVLPDPEREVVGSPLILPTSEFLKFVKFIKFMPESVP